MGYKQISGIEWACDHCEKVEMTSGQIDVNGEQIPPKGWFAGTAFESSGERGAQQGTGWVACKASCIGNAIRKMVDALRPEVETPKAD